MRTLAVGTDIHPAPVKLAQSLMVRRGRLIETRSAPDISYPDRSIDWPASSLSARVFAGGVQLRDIEDGFDEAGKIDDFLARHARNGTAFWGLGWEKEGIYVSSATLCDIRNWVKGELIVSPSVIMSLDEDVFMISDEQLHYSVIGADAGIMAELDDQFGGAENVLARLAGDILAREIGFGAEDAGWASRYLVPWSQG